MACNKSGHRKKGHSKALCDDKGMVRAILIMAVLAVLAGVANSWRAPFTKASSTRHGVSSSTMSVRRQAMSLSAKSKGPSPAVPAPEPKGVESKYLVALGVFLAACVFDFYRMHGGIAPWQAGGFW